MNDGGIQRVTFPCNPALVRRILLLMLICVFGFETTAFAGQAPVRLDDIQLAVQVGPSDWVSTPYGVTFRTSIKIDEEMPDDRMYIFIWHASNHQGFEPNTHTVLLADFFPFQYGEGTVATDEEGNSVLFTSHTASDDLLPGLTYYARAHVVAVNKSDFDQETHTFRVSYASDFSEEVSFILPSPLFLRSDIRYFLIDRYYRSSDDEYALIDEGEEEILYLQVRYDTMPRWFGEGDLFADLKLGDSTARPLPEVGDVVIFAQDLYDPQFMKNPLEIMAIDDTGHDMLRITVKQLPRYEVIEGDIDFQLKVDTSSGQAEIGFFGYGNDTGSVEGSTAVPKTGQTKSYRTGDDGDLKKGTAWPVPRFTDHGKGTVTDNLTGLMWVKAPHDLDGNSDRQTWDNAIDFCNGLNHAGHSDWRLPNVRELQSLIDYGRSAPVLPSGHPFTGVQSSIYWSSTTDPGHRGSAWAVHLEYGHTGDGAKASTSYVWPVRAGE